MQSSEPVRKSRKHKKSRATAGDGTRDAGPSSPAKNDAREPLKLQQGTGSSSSSRHGQLVDLVVEDRKAEERARVQAQKEFGSSWTEHDHKHFL